MAEAETGMTSASVSDLGLGQPDMTSASVSDLGLSHVCIPRPRSNDLGLCIQLDTSYLGSGNWRDGLYILRILGLVETKSRPVLGYASD